MTLWHNPWPQISHPNGLFLIYECPNSPFVAPIVYKYEVENDWRINKFLIKIYLYRYILGSNICPEFSSFVKV